MFKSEQKVEFYEVAAGDVAKSIHFDVVEKTLKSITMRDRVGVLGCGSFRAIAYTFGGIFIWAGSPS